MRRDDVSGSDFALLQGMAQKPYLIARSDADSPLVARLLASGFAEWLPSWHTHAPGLRITDAGRDRVAAGWWR